MRYRPADATFDRLLRSCRRELDPIIESAFAANAEHAELWCVIPFIGGIFLTYDGRARQDAKKKVRRALCSRQCFERTAPPEWGPLPIRMEQCETMLQNGIDNRQKLVGYFARSLAWAEWQYQLHPSFNVFCAGVMAVPSPSTEVRTLQADPVLRRMFPPAALRGFNESSICYPIPGTSVPASFERFSRAYVRWRFESGTAAR